MTKRLRAGRKKQKVNVRAFSVDIWGINVLFDFFLKDFSTSTEKKCFIVLIYHFYCVIVWLEQKQSNYIVREREEIFIQRN